MHSPLAGADHAPVLNVRSGANVAFAHRARPGRHSAAGRRDVPRIAEATSEAVELPVAARHATLLIHLDRFGEFEARKV